MFCCKLCRQLPARSSELLWHLGGSDGSCCFPIAALPWPSRQSLMPTRHVLWFIDINMAKTHTPWVGDPSIFSQPNRRAYSMPSVDLLQLGYGGIRWLWTWYFQLRVNLWRDEVNANACQLQVQVARPDNCVFSTSWRKEAIFFNGDKFLSFHSKPEPVTDTEPCVRVSPGWFD